MKSTTCHLTDAIVELSLDAPNDDVASHHLSRCEACRSATALAQRSLDVWKTDAPSAAEITAAKVRLAARRVGSAPRGRRPVWMLALALLVVGGGALAALRPASSQAQREAVTRAPAPPAEATTRTPSGAAVAPMPSAVETELPKEAAEPARPTSSSSVTAPSAIAIERSVAGDAALPNADPVTSRAVAAATAAPTEVPAAPARWKEVAEAMRRGDTRAADEALGALEKATDAPTRDAARLARAELAVSAGRRAEARAALTDLAANGATPLVRRRAAELLATAH